MTAPAYIVARVQVSDWDRYRQYMAHTPRVIAQFGGRFLVRGGEAAVLEGPDDGLRTVILGFPSLEQAKAFYASPEYGAVKALRDGAGTGTFTAVEGYDPAAWAEALAASRALDPPPMAPSTPSGSRSPSGGRETRLSPPSGGSTAEGREGGPAGAIPDG